MRTRGVKDTIRKPTKSTTWNHRNSQRLNQKPGRLRGTDIGPLHIYYSCIVWPSCVNPTNGSKGSLCLFWWLLRFLSSSCLYLDMPFLVNIHGKPTIPSIVTEEEFLREVREELGEEKGGEIEVRTNK